MTLRARLILGLLNIAVLLLLPLALALRALDGLHETTQALRGHEFAASLLLGKIRTQSDAVRNTETSLVVVKNDTAAREFRANIAQLRTLTDSLTRTFDDSTVTQIADAVRQV